METVNLFPQKYVGSLLVLDQCEVRQEVEPTNIKGLFALGVTSPGGTYIPGVLGRNGIAFCIGEKMAEKMSRFIGGAFVWPSCRISSAIMKVEDAHIAFVTELTVFNRGGNPSTAFKSDGTVVGLTPDKTVQETEAKLRAEWEASSSTLKQHYKTFENWRKAKSVK